MMNPRLPGDEGKITNGDIVVGSGSAGHDDVIADADMAGEHDVVGEDATGADLAIMTDVAIDHEQVAVTDAGDSPAQAGADVNGGAFPEDISAADDELRNFPAEFFILGDATDGAVGMEGIGFADGGVPGDDDMADEATAGAQGDMRTDGAEGAYFHVLCERGLGVNNG